MAPAIKLILQIAVPWLLEKLVKDTNVPSVTPGMIRDFEAKVGVPEAVRKARAVVRTAKWLKDYAPEQMEEVKALAKETGKDIREVLDTCVSSVDSALSNTRTTLATKANTIKHDVRANLRDLRRSGNDKN